VACEEHGAGRIYESLDGRQGCRRHRQAGSLPPRGRQASLPASPAASSRVPAKCFTGNSRVGRNQPTLAKGNIHEPSFIGWTRTNPVTTARDQPTAVPRRTIAVGASASSFGVLRGVAADAPAPEAKPAEFQRKIKLGVIGTADAAPWIANLFQAARRLRHVAVADYFQSVADAAATRWAWTRRAGFSTLSGYKKLIESGVEAVALETPPCFFPEHARAAVAAGLHVYMAKPVAVDVPGCLEIEAAAKKATAAAALFPRRLPNPDRPATTAR